MVYTREVRHGGAPVVDSCVSTCGKVGAGELRCWRGSCGGSGGGVTDLRERSIMAEATTMMTSLAATPLTTTERRPLSQVTQ